MCIADQPDLTNMELFREIERSGDLYPYFDYAHGYGIPQAGYFLKKEEIPMKPTFDITEEGEFIKVSVLDDFFTEEYDTSMMDDSEYIEEDTIYDEKDFGIENMENDTIIEIPVPDKVIDYKYKENDAIENEGNLDNATDYQEIEDTIDPDLPVEDEIYNEESVRNDILFNNPNYIDYLYYNIQGENGVLKNYHVIQVLEKEVISIQKGKPGTTLNVNYKGYTQSLKF